MSDTERIYVVERATEALIDEDRVPLLYDASDRPLYREVGFRSRRVVKPVPKSRPRSRKRFADG